MARFTIDLLHDGVMHDHSESDLGAILDPRYLKLDQSTPQTTVGIFTFPSVIATNYLKTPKIYPSADSTTAIKILKADGVTSVLNIDTTNSMVGIGTTAPGSKLHVSESITDTTPIVKLDNSYNATGAISSLALGVSGTTTFGGDYYHLTTVGNANNDIDFRIEQKYSYESTPRPLLTIKNSGNVGIGTTSPGSKLTVVGSITARETDDGGNAVSLVAGSGSGNVFVYAGGVATITLTGSSGNLAGNTLTMSGTGNSTIAGNVGIGTTAPGRKLEINTGAATGGIRLTYNDSNGSATVYTDLLVDSAGDLTVVPTGLDVILGTADSTKLWFGAGKNMSIYYNGTNAIINPKEVGSGYLDILGDVNATGYSVGATAGIDKSITVLDADGITTHALVFTKGILTACTTT